MNIEQLIEYCMSFAATTAEFPFDQKTLVMKVHGKMFLLVDVESPDSINVKCDPEKAVELRESFSSVEPGYHMNKKHWNTIQLNGELNKQELEYWIKHSYELVVSKLPKKLKDGIQN